MARTFKVLAKKPDADFDKNFSFAEVEPGDFIMGSDPKGAEKDSRWNNEVPHKVSITRGFEIGKQGVTRAQWKKIMGSLPREIKNDGKSDDLPITYVSWEEANEFTKKLTKELNDGNRYRLPTEAEREYAARGGQKVSPEDRQKAYSYGNNPDQLNDYAWNSNNSKGGSQPVGTKTANPLGLHDMHGNVWEWTMDKYVSDASKVKEDPDFGHPVNLTEGSYRVMRGGSWNDNPRYLRSAQRHFIHGPRAGFVGLRLVRTPE